MNGKELSITLTAIYPSLKTIFMSGYTADIMAHQGVFEQNVSFIQKPFMLKDLLAKINETLSTIH